MAMAPAGMAALIVEEIKALNDEVTGAEEAALLAKWTAICTGIINHIIAAAVVSGTVTSGAGSGGSVTGTVSG